MLIQIIAIIMFIGGIVGAFTDLRYIVAIPVAMLILALDFQKYKGN